MSRCCARIGAKLLPERRSEVKTQPELVGRAAKPVERRLIRMLAEAEGSGRTWHSASRNANLYHGLETEKIFAALVIAGLSGQPVQAAKSARCWRNVTGGCSSRFVRRSQRADLGRSHELHRGLATSPGPSGNWPTCSAASKPPHSPEMRGLLREKTELMRRLAAAR